MFPKPPNNLNRPVRGFTLIELLVVISIIALLISLLLPALKAARGTARSLACSSMVRQFLIANEVYANDHDGAYTPQSLDTNHNSQPFGPGIWMNNHELSRNMGFKDTNPGWEWPLKYHCPDATYAEEQANSRGSILWNSYNFNSTGIDDTQTSVPYALPPGPGPGSMSYSSFYRGVKRPWVEQPSKTVELGDNIAYNNFKMASNGPKFALYTGEKYGSKGIAYRHQGKVANMGFYDGHAASMRQPEVEDADRNNNPGIWWIAGR